MAALARRRLGTTTMEITRVGFGAWAIGGGGWSFGWGRQDDAESIAAIRHAVERGINWVDTASVYGLGHSEEVVGRALSSMPEAERPYVFTKCGMVTDAADPMTPARRVGTAAQIKADAEASLERLGLERIDLFQMHWPAEHESVEEYWQALLELIAEGKIAAAGLSNHDVADLEAAESLGHVDSLQPPFSMINRRAASGLLPYCGAHATGVIVYSPMQSGLLTGTWTKERSAELATDDWRRGAPEFTGVALEHNLVLAESLTPIANRHGCSVASVAIAWTLAFDAVTAAIVGARNPGQVDGWIEAADLELSAQDIDEITAAIDASGAGTGPTRPS